MISDLDRSHGFLRSYYQTVQPNPKVLELCGAADPAVGYTGERQDDLTAIINGYARPAYVPLIWESMQYQTCRPRETWLVQNHPGTVAEAPRSFFEVMRLRSDTRVIDSGINHGCWFRFLLAALYCRTRYVLILDDDTLPGRCAVEAALADMQQNPGVYGGRGLIIRRESDGPRYWSHDVYGWPVGTPHAKQVDFVGQFWLLETYWLHELLRQLPMRLVTSAQPHRECGEELYVSFVAQKTGLDSYVYGHGRNYNERWSSIQAYEMGNHVAAMHMTGGLSAADEYMQSFVDQGWRLINYTGHEP